MSETNHILARLDALERKTTHSDTDIKAQIETLLRLILMVEGEARVLQWVVQAVIACHPEPSRLRAIFESLSTSIASRLQDAAFETDIPPEQMRLILSKTAESVARWNEALSRSQ